MEFSLIRWAFIIIGLMLIGASITIVVMNAIIHDKPSWCSTQAREAELNYATIGCFLGGAACIGVGTFLFGKTKSDYDF